MNARLQTAEAKAKVLGVDQTIGQASLKQTASDKGWDASAVLAESSALRQGSSPPEGACNTGRALSAGIAQFHDDLINHIHLENNVLLSQFDDTEAHI